MFCVCSIFLGAMTPCSKGRSKNTVRPNDIQSHTRNVSLRQVTGEKRAVVVRTYGKLPLSFIANKGQVNGKVAFYETGAGHSTFFTRKGIVLSLQKADWKVHRIRRQVAKAKVLPGKSLIRKASEGHASCLRIRMLGMSKDVEIVPEDVQPGTVNYFIGNNPHKWHTDIPTYKSVLYRNAYPGIDIKFYGNNRQLEYDIIVKAGADPSKVKCQYAGAKDVHVTKAGDLAIELNNGQLIQKKPMIYQEINGKRMLCRGSFKVQEDRVFVERLKPLDNTKLAQEKVRQYSCSFHINTYHKNYPLIIDPVIVYSTYLGGNGWGDQAGGIAVDNSGNAYITGHTGSSFPTENALYPNYAGGEFDVFVMKINASGTALLYSTFLGGSDTDVNGGIAVDSAGNAYVTGKTYSLDFPIKNALYSTYDGGQMGTAFVTKINANGTALVYSTYFGGFATGGNSIAVDSLENAYITGGTSATDFPIKNAIFPNPGEGGDAYVAAINAGGTELVYSTYLGGGSGNSIAVDSAGNVYVTGETVGFQIKRADFF